MAATPLALDATFPAGVRFEEPVDVYGLRGDRGAGREGRDSGLWRGSLELPPDLARRRAHSDACDGVLPLSVSGRYVLGVTPGYYMSKEFREGLPPYELTVRRVAVSSLEAGSRFPARSSTEAPESGPSTGRQTK